MIVFLGNKIRFLMVLAWLVSACFGAFFIKPVNAQEAIASQLELRLDLSGQQTQEQLTLLLEFSEALLYANPADAKGFAETALERAEEIANLEFLIEAHRIIGLAEIYQGFIEKSFHHLSDALELSERTNDRVVLSNVHRAMGRFYQFAYNDESAKDHFISAMEIAEQYGLLRQTGLAYNAMGDLFMRAGQTEEALTYYISAMETLSTGPLTYLRSWPKASYGQALYRLGRYDEAIEVLTEAADESFSSGMWNAYGGAMVYKAHTQKALGQNDASIETYNFILANEFSRRYNLDLAEAYIGLADVYTSQDDPQQALQVLNIGVYELEALNYITEEMALVRKIIQIYHDVGNLEAAKEQIQRYFDLSDQFKLDQVFELSQALKAERAISSYEQELSQQQMALNQQENRLILVSAGLSVALMVVVVLILLVRGRSKRVKAIGQEKRVIEEVSDQRARLLMVIGNDLRASLRKIVATFGGLTNSKSENYLKNLGNAQMASQVALIATNNVHELANLEAGFTKEQTEIFVPAIEMDEMLDFWRIWAEENNVHFQLSLSKDLYHEVNAPLRAMEMILVNILSMVIRGMSSGRLKILAGYINDNDQDKLQVAIEYDGIIDHSYDLSKFQKMAQEMVRSKKVDLNQMNDIGIGLMVCLYLAKQIEADIGVELYNADNGRFWVSIPVEKQP